MDTQYNYILNFTLQFLIIDVPEYISLMIDEDWNSRKEKCHSHHKNT